MHRGTNPSINSFSQRDCIEKRSGMNNHNGIGYWGWKEPFLKFEEIFK